MWYSADCADPIVLDPGSTFIPLLEELVELISVETWRVLWKYVESRSKRFTKVHPYTSFRPLRHPHRLHKEPDTTGATVHS